MMDQQAKYSPRGLKVEFVGEAQTDLSCKERVLSGEVQLVFITPENIIENKVYREMLLSSVYQENLVALAVDEAHCVKSWGDQFRSFARIGDLRIPWIVYTSGHILSMVELAAILYRPCNT